MNFLIIPRLTKFLALSSMFQGWMQPHDAHDEHSYKVNWRTFWMFADILLGDWATVRVRRCALGRGGGRREGPSGLWSIKKQKYEFEISMQLILQRSGPKNAKNMKREDEHISYIDVVNQVEFISSLCHPPAFWCHFGFFLVNFFE